MKNAIEKPIAGNMTQLKKMETIKKPTKSSTQNKTIIAVTIAKGISFKIPKMVVCVCSFTILFQNNEQGRGLHTSPSYSSFFILNSTFIIHNYSLYHFTFSDTNISTARITKMPRLPKSRA